MSNAGSDIIGYFRVDRRNVGNDKVEKLLILVRCLLVVVDLYLLRALARRFYPLQGYIYPTY